MPNVKELHILVEGTDTPIKIKASEIFSAVDKETRILKVKFSPESKTCVVIPPS